MPITKADIIRELAKRELAKRESGPVDKAIDAVKSFDESQSKGTSTGLNLNLVSRLGLNPITDKSATLSGTEAERFALNLATDIPRMLVGLVDQTVANPYEALAGLIKAPIHIAGNLYKGVFGSDEQKAQALQETINSPLAPAALAGPIAGIAGRAMTPASMRGIDLAALQRTAAEARMTSPIDIPPPEPPAPLQLTYKPDTPNLGILRKRGEIVDRPMTPEEWQVWLANEEANAPRVTNYLTSNGKRFSTVNPNAKVLQADLSAKPSNMGDGFTFRNPRPGETPGLASQLEYKGSTPLQLEYNRGVSEIDPTVPKTEPVVTKPQQLPTSTESLSQPPVASVKGAGKVSKPSPVKLPDVQSVADERHAQFMAKAEDIKRQQAEIRQILDEAKPSPVSTPVKESNIEYREAGLRPQVLAKNMPEPLRRGFYSAEGRIKLPESKQLFSGIEESTKIQKANLEGPWMEETRSTGLGKLTHEDAARIRTELESGNAGVVTGQRKIFNLVPAGKVSVATDRIRKVLEDVWTQAKAAGIEIGKVKNYFPRIIKREVAELIDDDLRSVVVELEKSENVSDVAVAKALESAHAKTQQIIQHMIDTKQAKGYNDAVKNLYYAAQHDLYKVTSFEKHRSLATELPSWVYETDARQVIPMYIEAMSKRIADARVFGPNGEKAQPLIDAIKSKDMKEAQLVEEVYRTHAGLQQQLHPMSHVPRKTIDALTGFLYGTKITVKSTIPNLIQTLHSVGKDYGITRMAQATKRLLTDTTFREEIRRTGVVDLDMVQAMSGYHPGGVWGKFADLTTKAQGFKHANRMNQYLSAATAKVFIEEAYAKVNGQKNVWFGPKRVEWFKQELADLGIDYTKPLDDAAVARAMYKVASDTQLMHNILKEPVWMNNQRLRVLALFKRFAYRQAKYQVDTLTKEFSRGNYVPALRLAAQGYLAAQFTGWANDMLRKALSGENVYSDNEGWRKFIEAMAQVGAVGVFSDIAMGLTTQTPSKSVIDKTKFALTPVAVDAAMKGYDVASKTAGDIDKLGTGPALRKNVDEILQFISPVLGYAGDRMLTQREQSYRDVYRKANKKNEILDVILMGDAERAKRMIQRWNEANKNNPALVITGKDINGKAVKNRAENKAKSQAGVR